MTSHERPFVARFSPALAALVLILTPACVENRPLDLPDAAALDARATPACGPCGPHRECIDGTCKCTFLECGAECCADDEICDDHSLCYDPTEACKGKKCGDDGHGGTCGTCEEDHLWCTRDQCNDGICNYQALEPGTCLLGGKCWNGGQTNQGDSCQICDPVTTASTWSKASDGTSCSDGDACTLWDMCIDGTCAGTPRVGMFVWEGGCNDEDPCTDDSCDPETGFCTAAPATGGEACNDGSVCTLDDICVNGACNGTTFKCDDANLCTTDSCDPEQGCIHSLNEAPCDDGNICTTSDYCHLGNCLGGGQFPCDDNNPCTTDGCKPAAGCEYEAKEDGTPCGDELGVCHQGTCLGGVICGSTLCPLLEDYEVSCNAKEHCEYANVDATAWKYWDVWVYIASGGFEMGSVDNEGSSNELPVHQVTIGYGYFIAKYEVVVQQYEACIAAGNCSSPSTVDWPGDGWGTNSTANSRAYHPQNGLKWQQAKDFCDWVTPGGRLPSEAEWEYAAKGPTHVKYPWGDGPKPTCENNTAVFSPTGNVEDYGCGFGGTWAVGLKAAGGSWCGALDMSGNVREWTEDWYHSDYAGAPDDGSPWVSPAAATRLVRGGSFNQHASEMRSARRRADSPDKAAASIGARCARTAE